MLTTLRNINCSNNEKDAGYLGKSRLLVYCCTKIIKNSFIIRDRLAHSEMTTKTLRYVLFFFYKPLFI